MKNVRLKQMERFISEKKFVTIEEISEKFHIHPNTARTDVKELVERGIVQKRYGGVKYITPDLEIGFNERRTTNVAAKERIGYKAAGLLEENDIIYIDVGSTVLHLLQPENNLPKHLIVISSSLEVLKAVSANTDYTLFALPGQYNKQIGGFVGLETIESLKAYSIKKAFIGIKAISEKGELVTDSNIDAKVKNTAIEASKVVVLMAESQKMDQSALFNFSTLSDVDYWVCDEETPVMKELSEKHNFSLIK